MLGGPCLKCTMRLLAAAEQMLSTLYTIIRFFFFSLIYFVQKSLSQVFAEWNGSLTVFFLFIGEGTGGEILFEGYFIKWKLSVINFVCILCAGVKGVVLFIVNCHFCARRSKFTFSGYWKVVFSPELNTSRIILKNKVPVADGIICVPKKVNWGTDSIYLLCTSAFTCPFVWHKKCRCMLFDMFQNCFNMLLKRGNCTVRPYHSAKWLSFVWIVAQSPFKSLIIQLSYISHHTIWSGCRRPDRGQCVCSLTDGPHLWCLDCCLFSDASHVSLDYGVSVWPVSVSSYVQCNRAGYHTI